MKTVQSEIARAKKVNGAVTKAKFSSGVRSLDLNNLNDGDIIQIPEKYEVLSQPIRGSKNEDGTQNSAEYIFVNVKRNNVDVPVQFYPSLFWRRREVADSDGIGTGEYRISDGEVVDFVQGYSDIDEALAAIRTQHPNGFKVTKNATFKSPRFGGNGVQNAWVPTLTWA